jgi:hypothetical protein
MKTPTKSPGGFFQSLPSLDDAALKSPVGIFLSPHPPTPTSRSINEMGPFDNGIKSEKPAGSKSPKTRDLERERFVATPTDFAMDYGRHSSSGPGTFDTSNGKCGIIFFCLAMKLALSFISNFSCLHYNRQCSLGCNHQLETVSFLLAEV